MNQRLLVEVAIGVYAVLLIIGVGAPLLLIAGQAGYAHGSSGSSMQNTARQFVPANDVIGFTQALQ